MNIMQIAILLIRLSSLGWFLDGLLEVTYLPTDLLGIGHFQSGYFAVQHELEILLKLFRIFLHVAIGSYFLIRAEAVARWATKGLERFSSQPQTGVWPPAPRADTEQPPTPPREPVVLICPVFQQEKPPPYSRRGLILFTVTHCWGRSPRCQPTAGPSPSSSGGRHSSRL